MTSFARFSSLIVAAMASLVVAGPMEAQAGLTWAADASVGAAHVGGGEFVDHSTSAERIAASVGKKLGHGIGVDAEAGYEWFGNLDIRNGAICIVSTSGGSCLPYLPMIGGPSGLVGLSVDASRFAELRMNVGVAAYSVDNTRLGAPLTAIDVALTPVSWFGIVIGGRAFVLPNYRGARLTTTALQFGFRIRTRN